MFEDRLLLERLLVHLESHGWPAFDLAPEYDGISVFSDADDDEYDVEVDAPDDAPLATFTEISWQLSLTVIVEVADEFGAGLISVMLLPLFALPVLA